MTRKTNLWLATAAAVALIAAWASPAVQADALDETAIFIEINDTDGDAGIQIFLDAEGWEKMQVVDPDGKVLLDLTPKHSARMQGMTEAFFESAEPSFEEQPLADFLALWPEGVYRFRGRTNEDEEEEEGEEEAANKAVPLRGRAVLTHILPAAPQLILPIEGDEEVDPDDTVIEWGLVADPAGSEIVSYEVIVETDDDDVPFREFRVLVDPDVTSVTVPPEFMQPGTDYKFEVIAKETSGNQTISEREFATEGDDEEEEEEEEE